jgi:hypothetical protein
VVDLLQECNAIECATGAGDGDEASISISININSHRFERRYGDWGLKINANEITKKNPTTKALPRGSSML